MYKNLLKLIQKYDNITIFRHARPDGDCVFSALALYYFIKDNFKDKKVKLAGIEEYDIISKIEKVSDQFIISSLAIVLDTASINRVDDKRCINADYIVKIDHHPALEQYGNMNIVDDSSSATCELLADILMSNDFKSYQLSKKVIKYLYSGIVTDTNNFSTANTTSTTLSIASKLAEKGGLKISDLVEWLTNVDLSVFKKDNYIRNSLIIKKKFGYVQLNSKQLNEINMSPIDAKNRINEIGHINDLNVWAFAVQNGNKYDVSVRSKRDYIINETLRKYNGGGHKNAAATRQITLKELNSLFKELIEISTK